jgi:glutathione S-transferase
LRRFVAGSHPRRNSNRRDRTGIAAHRHGAGLTEARQFALIRQSAKAQSNWGLPMNQIYTAAVTLLALLVYLVISGHAGRARTKYGVTAPAVTGSEMFERAYRVQMNTLEQMAFFLPSLWLYAVLVSDKGAAVGGVIWILARIVYAIAYNRDPKTRGFGAAVSALAQVGLFLGAAYGVVRAFIG